MKLITIKWALYLGPKLEGDNIILIIWKKGCITVQVQVSIMKSCKKINNIIENSCFVPLVIGKLDLVVSVVGIFIIRDGCDYGIRDKLKITMITRRGLKLALRASPW